MDIKGINKLIDDLKDNLGDALLMSDVSSFKIGSSMAAYNSNPKTAALINKFSKYLVDIIAKTGVGDNCEYYAVEVAGGIMMYVLLANDYCWSIMVDGNQVANGLMVAGVLPDCIAGLKAATK